MEDTLRVIKQRGDPQDVQGMTYRRRRNLATLGLAAACLAAVCLVTRPRLTILARNVLNAVARFFRIPGFRCHALADGIREILGGGPQGKSRASDSPAEPNPQADLPQP